MSGEQPILSLGLAGFAPQQVARLTALLSQLPEGLPAWQVVAPFAEADAWWVNGSGVHLLPDGTLMVPGGRVSEPPLQLSLADVDRPIAFSTPLASSDFEPMYTFDMASEASVREALQQFEHWLRPVRAQFSLAALINERERSLQAGVYHVAFRDTLLAVVDMQAWQVGYLPTASALDFERAHWHKRPPSANDIPHQFVRASLTQIMWNYAQRTTRNVLPERYRSELIYFRRAPRVPLRVLKDSQLMLLRELAQAPAKFQTLVLQTGLGEAQLARDLASLYFAGSITSTRSHAAASPRLPEFGGDGGLPSDLSSGLSPSPIGADSGFTGRVDPLRDQDFTVSAPLRPN